MREIVQTTCAELVGVEGHLGYAPHELSGGQKQRVSLAGVMVDEVKILLFDEPLANLDPATGKQTIELIDRIQKKTRHHGTHHRAPSGGRAVAGAWTGSC